MMRHPFDSLMDIIVTSFYEPSTLTEIVMAYCFLALLFVIELILPITFGLIETQMGAAPNHLAASLFQLVDKLGIVLLCYCLSALLLDVLIPGRFTILNFWNWLCGGKLS